jgi:hypothetical protein
LKVTVKELQILRDEVEFFKNKAAEARGVLAQLKKTYGNTSDEELRNELVELEAERIELETQYGEKLTEYRQKFIAKHKRCPD